MGVTLLSAGIFMQPHIHAAWDAKISTTVDVYGFLTPDMAVAGLDCSPATPPVA